MPRATTTKPAARSPKSADAAAPGDVRYAALLRGINVGGNNKLPMSDLAALCASAGCRRIATYIQSGNVVFSATPADAAALPGALSAAIAKRLGLAVPVVLRSVDELRAVIASNPFIAAGADPATLHVLFLADAPDVSALAGLDPQRSPGDEYRVVGRDVYLRLPNGVARSKLTNAYFDAKLRTVSTGRNWRTVQTLLAMASGA